MKNINTKEDPAKAKSSFCLPETPLEAMSFIMPVNGCVKTF